MALPGAGRGNGDRPRPGCLRVTVLVRHKGQHGWVVPTWNYVTTHAYGRLVVHDDPAWVEAVVRRLTAKHEAAQPQPWTVDDAPPGFVAGQLRAIVGIEVLISRVQAKAKLSLMS